ncbi:bifunctional transcriptional activator/DNA repair enzyme AdaA [Clostridium sp. 'White wine YQ']|uniref:bifunctional transcriptional activator/DNA repair enzyme AdaA n=1 Tax=Clostridium sp. 'White wine YQ' TaxID=3027474 RepID=UPI002366A980|nr:Ada metal-binding domain-containing protein [Clostridium sp. 'White wine YQ']MDD7793370.1 Ada metal-binding domain-containing protein [Clostridium sp. 'White wine YQ']
MSLKEEEKWNAVINNDENYDGVFYYGVKTTGIVCKPSCKSKEPLRDNVMFFNTFEEAINKNFRPCKRCRPDLLNFNPTEELAFRIKKLFDSYYSSNIELEEKLKDLGVSQNHMIKVFSDKFGITPVKYINALRIEKALALLENTDDTVINIAFLCGFESNSNFYGFFKKQIGMTPSEYRSRL